MDEKSETTVVDVERIETKPAKVRNTWPEHLKWPPPPEGLHAFLVLVMPKFAGAERPRPRRSRLGELSTEELSWVAMTLSVELRRRQHRPTTEGNGNA